jgi:hypothetical protein
MDESESHYWTRRRRVRWCFYNQMFRLFGKTRFWPWLGQQLW